MYFPPSPWDLERLEWVKHNRSAQWLRLRMKTVDKLSWDLSYVQGYRPPRYPVPAVVVRTGFMPSGGNGMRGIPYIWLMYGYNRLTTFWKGHDTVVEWFDTDGNRHLKREVSIGRD